MSISEQNTRYQAIFDALEQIKKSNGFLTNVVKVLRGIRGLDDFSGDLPGISIYKPLNDNKSNQYGGTESEMTLNIWGFCKVEARVNDYDNLDSLAADVEMLLMSETYNPYLLETYIQRTAFYEGGIQDSFGFFNMEVKMLFDHELTAV